MSFASVANAANEHPAKTEHFSMLELNRRLSALILEKYPKAHIDSDAFSINACNSLLTQDTSVDNHSCLDSQVPDSADFTLHLSVPVEPIDVPIGGLGSWTYDAIIQLDLLGVKIDVPQSVGTAKPLTRYDFAVAIARLLEQKDKRANDSQKVKVLIAKLALEFEQDLLKLDYPLDHDKFIKELADAGIVWRPRYQFMELKFKYGKKFNLELHEKIEKTIADYAAAWLKSNSPSYATPALK